MWYLLSVSRGKWWLKRKECFNKKIYMESMRDYSTSNLTLLFPHTPKTRNHTWFWCSDNCAINITCFSCNSGNFKKICRIGSQMCHYKTDRLLPHRAYLTPCQHARWIRGTWWRCNSTKRWRRAGSTP